MCPDCFVTYVPGLYRMAETGGPNSNTNTNTPTLTLARAARKRTVCRSERPETAQQATGNRKRETGIYGSGPIRSDPVRSGPIGSDRVRSGPIGSGPV